MVRGIEVFKERFSEYAGQYAFIGGAACDVILGKMGIDFRTTKDLDIVLLIEDLDENFVEAFIEFIEDGGYQHIKKGTDGNQFYRFEKPKSPEFPYMIELFSRKPEGITNFNRRLAPIHVADDAMSLSAILLDDEYYRLFSKGVIIVDGISVLRLEYLILFKMKAWCDLSERKLAGEDIDSKSIKKHKNDVFRLIANIDNGAKVEVSDIVKHDMRLFMIEAEKNPVDLKSLGIRNVTYQELLNVAYGCFE